MRDILYHKERGSGGTLENDVDNLFGFNINNTLYKSALDYDINEQINRHKLFINSNFIIDEKDDRTNLILNYYIPSVYKGDDDRMVYIYHLIGYCTSTIISFLCNDKSNSITKKNRIKILDLISRVRLYMTVSAAVYKSSLGYTFWFELISKIKYGLSIIIRGLLFTPSNEPNPHYELLKLMKKNNTAHAEFIDVTFNDQYCLFISLASITNAIINKNYILTDEHGHSFDIFSTDGTNLINLLVHHMKCILTTNYLTTAFKDVLNRFEELRGGSKLYNELVNMNDGKSDLVRSINIQIANLHKCINRITKTNYCKDFDDLIFNYNDYDIKKINAFEIYKDLMNN